MRSVALAAGLVGVTILALAVPAAAQPAYEDTVLVTASLDAEERDELPTAVDFVAAEEIAARQATEVAEVLATLPGITVSRSGPPGQVTSVFIRGAESDQTLVLWNGIELNDPYFGGFNFAFLPVDGAARIEVVRGPASALYGSDAVGGVVQVLTSPQRGASARLEAGDHDYLRASLAGGGGLGSAAHLDLIGVLRRGDSEFENGFWDGGDAVASLSWQPRANAELGMRARGAEADTGIPFSNGVPSPRRRFDWEEWQVATPFSATTADWQVEGSISRVELASSFRDPDDAFGFVAGDTDSRSERGRAVATWRGRPDAWVAFGADAERLEVDDRSNFGASLTGARQRTWAGFGQLHWGWRRLRLDAGLRRDDNDVYGEELSPRLGLVWSSAGQTVVRLAWGEGFRAPSIGELFFPFSGNAALEPETSESAELGVEQRAGRVRLAAAAFRTRQRNLIDFDFATLRNFNIGRTQSRGVEFEVAYESPAIVSRFNVTWLDAEDLETGLPLLRRPDESASLSLTLRPDRWTLNTLARYVGDRPDRDAATLERTRNPGYLAIDLAASWQATKRLAPYARVENAGDRRYQEALGSPAPGRTAIAGLAVTF